MHAGHQVSRRTALLAMLAGGVVDTRAADIGLRHGRDPPVGIGGPIELIDQFGARFTLRRVEGQPVLLFFGFTHCGSTCPSALGVAREVLQGLDASARAAVVFVTLDPLNDPPEALRRYLGLIDARIIGLTGSLPQIERAVERYGVGLRQVAGTLEHSSVWYLLDGASRVRRVYPHTTPAVHLLADIRRLQAMEG